MLEAYCAIPRHNKVSTSGVRCARSMEARPSSRMSAWTAMEGDAVVVGDPCRIDQIRPQRGGADFEREPHAVLEVAAIGAHDTAGRIRLLFILNEEVVAEEVKLVGVHSRFVGAGQPFTQFDIEDLETEAAGRIAVLDSLRQTEAVMANFGIDCRFSRGRRGGGAGGQEIGKGALHPWGGTRGQLQLKRSARMRDHWFSIRHEL